MLDIPPLIWYAIRNMNNSYSPLVGEPEGGYVPRWAAPLVLEALREARVVVLTGARQVGKSTLLAHECAHGWRSLSLDDYDVLGQAQHSPADLLSVDQPTIIDEVQRAPGLLLAVKRVVDTNRTRRFILSGSANLALMAAVTETLAGRARYIELRPFSVGEARRAAPGTFCRRLLAGTMATGSTSGPTPPLAPLVWRGGMPATVRLDNDDAATRWREGYVATYLERDLRQLSQIEHLADFRRLMGLAALRCGGILNTSGLARDAGLSQPTAHRYLNILEISGFVHRVPAYTGSRTLRLVKAPKLLMTDTGIAAYLAGLHHVDSLATAREWGGLLEAFVYQQMLPQCDLMTPRPRIYHWRTRTNQEVDFVLEQGRSLAAVEVKAGSHVGYDDIQGLQAFHQAHPSMRTGVVLHAGHRTEQLAERIFAVPISVLWS